MGVLKLRLDVGATSPVGKAAQQVTIAVYPPDESASRGAKRKRD